MRPGSGSQVWRIDALQTGPEPVHRDADAGPSAGDRAVGRRIRDSRPVDILATHSPALGLGDGDDPPHRGYASFHRLLRKLAPRYHLHGHLHSYGRVVERQYFGSTTVINVVVRTVLDI